MEQIEFVKTGLMTSRIGLGTWAMGGWMWGGTDEAQSIATIHTAIDRGVTLIDTAPVYGFGRSEEIVGKALEFEREVEADVLPYATGAELTILSYGALCRGLLSGRMTADTKFEGDDLRKVDPKFQGKRYPQYLAAVDELKKLARDRFGKSVLALAVRWVLDQGPTIALWGARHRRQLDPIGDVEGWHIDAATKAEINAILKRCIVDPVSPAFMAPPVSRPKEQEVA
jgi:aryl-alcohol dehydrogenase-like predicted oxidoreductase